MSSSRSPSPPVRSTLIGALAAATFDSMSQSASSMAAISSVEYVVTPASSTALTIASLWPINPLPGGQPINRWPHTDPLRPRRLGCPPGPHGVERGLGFAVGAVAAEHAAVGRAG